MGKGANRVLHWPLIAKLIRIRVILGGNVAVDSSHCCSPIGLLTAYRIVPSHWYQWVIFYHKSSFLIITPLSHVVFLRPSSLLSETRFFLCGDTRETYRIEISLQVFQIFPVVLFLHILRHASTYVYLLLLFFTGGH